MKYKQYPSYRDSEVEWLGEIPEHWQLATVSRLFDIKAGGDVKKEYFSEEKSSDFPYPIYTNSTKKEAVYGYSKKAFFHENTITVSGRGYIGYAIYREHKYDAIIRLLVLSPKRNKPCKFFMYYINDVLDFQVANTAISQLSTEQISPYRLVLPPLQEQQTIANYLDTATAKIDTLIAKQTKLIELLKEKRQALISSAVTKGLDSSVAMKDSGVEWLGEIPEHWEVSRVKFHANIKGRIGFRGYTKEDLVEKEEGALVLGASEMNNNAQVVLKSPQYITWHKYYESPEIILKKNDILFVQRGSTVGKVAYIDYEIEEATINPSLVVLKQIKLEEAYLKYFLMSDIIKSIVKVQTSNTAIPMISQEQIGNYILSKPHKTEQQAIANYLDDKTSKIDTLISKSIKAIDLLKEKRTALISSAVTGKIDVREVE
ncbi:MAG: restriction endonuclease subunit S [Campylobacterota bacterium]|nr:restriction endonuclease subunit S [Campylobacterota bacterium]